MILASPVKHCLVLTPEDALARVIETDDATARVSVRLIEENATRTFNAEKLRCGFSVGQEVEHHPLLPNRTGLGIGKIQSIRSIAGHEQVLVHLGEGGMGNHGQWDAIKLSGRGCGCDQGLFACTGTSNCAREGGRHG